MVQKLEALKPFQFGVFDEDSHEALSAANIQKRRKVYLAVGSPNQKQFNQGTKVERLSNQGNNDLTFRTDPFPTRNVDIVRFQVPKRGEKPNVYYLGYNGIDTCETLKFDCGKTYTFHVLAKGRPVRHIFGNEFREVIEVTTDCCDSCNDTACSSGVGCEGYIDQLIDNFNNSLWVGRFFTAEKVISCEPALPSLTTTSFNVYTLTVNDAGDELALSKVQDAYPTLDVKVKSRKGIETTYEVTKTGAAPATFTQGKVVIPNCDECPSGFTLTASGYSAIVEIDNANPEDALGAVQAIWADATSVSLVKFSNGTATYHIVSDSEVTNPGAGVDAALVMTLGVTSSYCTKDSEVSTSWVLRGTKYKAQRDLCITVKPEDCGVDAGAATTADLLAMLTAHDSYVSGSLELDADSTDCLLRFTASQYNNAFLEDGCDTYDVAKFDNLPTFKGANWGVCPCEGWTVNGDGCPIPPVPTDRCCQCGIKFTGRPTTEILDRFPGYDINEYLEKEPIELHITVLRDDPDTRICSFETPTWLHAQRATFRQLRGDDVVKRVITDRFYNKELWVNQIDKENQLFLKREGIKLGVDLEAYYYAVDVYFNNEINTNNNAAHNQLREVVTLFVHEEDILTLESIKQMLADSFVEAKFENFV